MQAVKYDYDLDEQAERIGLITGVSNEIYFRSISRVSDVYVEFIKGQWVAWRESYVPNTNKRTSYKLIAQGDFELVLARVKNYLKFISKGRN
ncbi:pathogenicity island protein [Staphylococcus hominis]|uniref:Pathogenicity island protein n=1 Tax=Staphylococcus haemolyticus TaxID=1283 RepID=A0AB38PDW5_STAHA|nr:MULTISPECIES: pathogenicity island protein [Staphylococcus]MDY4023274.1 pathogenicity island protein [Staphylococcus borealis]PTK38615.1 pathogenicity island protein [Staphylococcus hominis]PTK52594.1 pathogenicity island protein [Staphylococcus haemolyticus]RIO48013.1 pathogenicity island protein [Staphylococcus hominis]TRL76954.1 pathogenicity island protein [Staphylococcus haemolyticus]